MMYKIDLARIEEIRKSQGISQNKISKAIGIQRESYNKKEQGAREFKAEEFINTVRFLGFEVNEIDLFLEEV